MTMKIMEVKQCQYTSGASSNPDSFKDHSRFYFKESKEQLIKKALVALEERFAKDVEIHDANKEALENNQKIRSHIIQMMKDFGIPDSYSIPDPKSRARFPKRITKRPGYVDDIVLWVKTSDGFEAAQTRYKTLKEKLETMLKEEQQAEEEAKQEKERLAKEEAEERRKVLALAKMIVKYELDDMATWDDVLEHLRSKNNLLDLAIAMMDTRGDWSEGPYRVENALGFTPETDLEKWVHEDISEITDNWYDHGGDGRVYRDCQWNYDVILGKIEDQDLVKDALEAHDQIDRW